MKSTDMSEKGIASIFMIGKLLPDYYYKQMFVEILKKVTASIITDNKLIQEYKAFHPGNISF
jgi:hypothetical protein